MNTITFTVPGAPRGKGRPRFARRGAHVTTYTDDQTASYENLVRLAYVQAGGTLHAGVEVEVNIHAMFPIPKSFSKAKREKAIAWEIAPQTKPDLDNVCKAVLDGLNGVAYADDKQVTRLWIEKLYGEVPRLDVEMTFNDTMTGGKKDA